MAKIGCRPTVQAKITLELDETEAFALDALVGYGIEPFLKVFYEHMGRAYLQPYEAGLRSLFESVRCGEASVEGFLRKAREARQVFEGRKVARDLPPRNRTTAMDLFKAS